MTVLGGDVSLWEDDNTTSHRPDFQKAYDKGWRFCYHKASQNLFPDPDYKVNWKNSRDTLLYLGVYHFLVWDTSPEEQAEFFWNLVKEDPGELPLIVDFEWWKEIPSNALSLLRRFLEKLKTLTNRKLGIYTGYYFWKEYGSQDKYWQQYYLWLAWYDSTPPKIPLPWVKIFVQQYTSHGDGLFYGMEGKDVDLNLFMGTYGEFLEILGILDPSSPPPENENDDEEKEENSMLKMKTLYPLNVRTGPSTSFSKIRTLPIDAVVTVYNVGGKTSAWISINPENTEWCCVQDINTVYLIRV